MVQQLVLVTFAIPLEFGAEPLPPRLQACCHDIDIADHRFRIFVAGGCLVADWTNAMFAGILLLAPLLVHCNAAADDAAIHPALATVISSAYHPAALGNTTTHPLLPAGRQVSVALVTRALQEHQKRLLSADARPFVSHTLRSLFNTLPAGLQVLPKPTRAIFGSW